MPELRRSAVVEPAEKIDGLVIERVEPEREEALFELPDPDRFSAVERQDVQPAVIREDEAPTVSRDVEESLCQPGTFDRTFDLVHDALLDSVPHPRAT